MHIKEFFKKKEKDERIQKLKEENQRLEKENFLRMNETKQKSASSASSKSLESNTSDNHQDLPSLKRMTTDENHFKNRLSSSQETLKTDSDLEIPDRQKLITEIMGYFLKSNKRIESYAIVEQSILNETEC